MEEHAIWALEQQLWLGDARAYEDLLDPACLMAFPSRGIMRAAEILDSLLQAPRRSSVEMKDCSVGRAGSAVIVLAYTAEGRRDGDEPYRCLCTSTYRADGECWKLVQHQQSVADE